MCGEAHAVPRNERIEALAPHVFHHDEEHVADALGDDGERQQLSFFCAEAEAVAVVVEAESAAVRAALIVGSACAGART